jgi:Mg-chelatase subunit ChlD
MSNAEQIAKLSEYDFIVVIDASGSMGTTDLKGGRSRWAGMQETVESFARDLGQLDSDGIDVVVFSGSGIDSFTGVTPNKVSEIFQSRQPRSSTPLAEALEASLKLANKSDKKDFIIVFTDGAPDDSKAAAKVITEQANRQTNDEDCTFLFVQVGYDKLATEYLRSLDDDLTKQGAKFDIVDAKTIEEAEKFPSTAELVLHSIND